MAVSSTTFKKGEGGRRKGATGKITTSIRGMIKTLVENNLEKVQQDFDSMEPKERVAMLIKLLEFTTPKLRSVSQSYDLSVLSDEEVNTLFNKITESTHHD